MIPTIWSRPLMIGRMTAGPPKSFYKIDSHSCFSTNNSVWLLRENPLLTAHVNLTPLVIQIFVSVTNLPKSGFPLHSMLDEIENLACSRLRGMLSLPIEETSWKNKIRVKSLKNIRQWVSDLLLPGSPHPKRIASWSTYWSGSVLAAGGKQAGATLLERATGESMIMMAISLA